ncbi:Eukaryotic translation initiation factor 3 subunit A [Chamberlinius hualienensis]
MPTYFQRPENALKRANEFIDVGKKQRALDALYDVIKSKRHRTWQKIHEPIMNKYLELCVDLKKSHVAKEGLFQYRNICQQVNIKSLEDVVRGYLHLAEEKTEAAREESHLSVVDIDDLDNMQTPERLLLSAVSGEDAQDRTDRVVLTPWVKFLWESYRQCLELLRNNSRVERLYHDIAQQAFKFCLKYSRKTEFRKLCDNLRTHLGHIHKHQNQQTAVNLNNPESQAMHLETRLCQLDSAIQMELWQEAYKAIEDIHGLMSLPKKAPKPQLLSNYYQKLALVFWKAGNYLFHASALFRLFNLHRELKKTQSPEEQQKMASRVLLSTLSIPIPPPRNEIDRSSDADEAATEKKRRLATLLGLPNPPTRQTLIKDLTRFNITTIVSPQLQELFQWIEVEFHPLQLCSRAQQCFEAIQSNEEMGDLHQYIPALQDNTLVRLLKQIAQVYQTIKFERLQQLASFADMFYLERIVVDTGRYSDLQVRVDHRTQTLYFGTGPYASQRDELPEGPQLQSMPSEQIRNQLVQISSVMHKTVAMVQSNKSQQERDQLRQTIVMSYLQNAKEDHMRILSRRQIIEDRKEMLENLSIQREEEERRQLEDQRKKQMLLEEERLVREAEEREKQRRNQELQEITKKHVKDKIEQLKKTGLGAKIFMDIDEEELEKLNADEIMQRQMEQLDRERREFQAKLKSQEKKFDHLARAKRLEEIPLIQKAWEEKKIKDKEFWEHEEKQRIKLLIEERNMSLQQRDRLKRIVEDKEKYVAHIKAARHDEYEAKRKDFESMYEIRRAERLTERKDERKKARRTAWIQAKKDEALRKKLEEEERIATELREIEDKKRQELLAAEREMRAKLDAQAAKQRARDMEIEERRKQEINETSATSEKAKNVDKSTKEQINEERSWRNEKTKTAWRKDDGKYFVSNDDSLFNTTFFF